MRGKKQNQQEITLLKDGATSPFHIELYQNDQSLNESKSDASSIDLDQAFRAQNVVFIQNQFEGLQIENLADYQLSEEDEQQSDLKALPSDSKEEKRIKNIKVLSQIIEKVSKDIDNLNGNLRSLKENNYSNSIDWIKEEYLHIQANLKLEEDQRELILLKKKKLERIRRDVLKIPNLKGEECPSMFLALKNIQFKEDNQIIKDLFAALDLIVNKNSMIGFQWKQFVNRVLRNKDSIDAYIYKMKYFSFNEMTDYFQQICIQFTEEQKELLGLFEDTKDKQVPLEIFLVKPFIEWMNIMKYGYKLSQDLIESIKKINSVSQETEKMQLNLDILVERNRQGNEHKRILQDYIEFLSSQINKLKIHKQKLLKNEF